MSNTFFENLSQVEDKERGFVDLEKLAELENIQVIYSKHKEYKDIFSGLIKIVDSRYVIIINGDHSHNRKRFTLAHELAHYFLHKEKIEKAAIVDDALYRSGLANDNIEVAANKFASKILMPEALVSFHINEAKKLNIIDIAGILNYVAEKLQVSKQALAIKIGVPFDN
ncbi:MAG: ImmA/IrrE family metallo-endopeptidase [Alphaproteobacteria bacterium]|jgi:Zn-dependent peptidase ImmA (M78 family)|nr:ImmA/IrrE family metallo-endopeptidase [Alphaproteobacteria bacterium]